MPDTHAQLDHAQLEHAQLDLEHFLPYRLSVLSNRISQIIANAYAGLEMGVTSFDACVGGLGGCPFAGNQGAAGNVCTEDLVFMLNEMGIESGVDLDKLIECAVLAEEIVGHPLPGRVKLGRNLDRIRDRVREAQAAAA